jgi:hypothetical protein
MVPYITCSTGFLDLSNAWYPEENSVLETGLGSVLRQKNEECQLSLVH